MKEDFKGTVYPRACTDCGAGIGQPCVSGCPNLDTIEEGKVECEPF